MGSLRTSALDIASAVHLPAMDSLTSQSLLSPQQADAPLMNSLEFSSQSGSAAAMPRRTFLAAGSLTSLSLLVACASKKEEEKAAPTAKIDAPASEFIDNTGSAVVSIVVSDNKFSPKFTIVDEGTKVTWSNEGRNPHNIVETQKGAFQGVSQAEFAPGAVHSVTFDTPGDFPYYCSIHGTPKAAQYGGIRVVKKA
ncbi:MAG TPA: hypothetical protein DEG43_11015 [Acidimicrobiaceae bacterium]|nr:hypothetical protein [Acidimicrobiaceae bacterium]